MYKAPGTNIDSFNTQFDSLLSTVKDNRNIYMNVGDFNLNMLNVYLHASTTSFYNISIAYCLTPSISKPTRISEFTSTIIDNIFISTVKYKCNSTILCADISNHYPIMLELADMKEFPIVQNYKKRIYDPTSIKKITETMENIDWSKFNTRCREELDTNLLYHDFFYNF